MRETLTWNLGELAVQAECSNIRLTKAQQLVVANIGLLLQGRNVRSQGSANHLSLLLQP